MQIGMQKTCFCIFIFSATVLSTIGKWGKQPHCRITFSVINISVFLTGLQFDPLMQHQIVILFLPSAIRAKFISAEEKTGITFDDFAGQEYIKRELQEIVRILKNEDEFQNKGIYCPKGVLLHGPPGTGKTLLAKAIAGEAGLPFFAANGTDFVEVRSTHDCNLQIH